MSKFIDIKVTHNRDNQRRENRKLLFNGYRTCVCNDKNSENG